MYNVELHVKVVEKAKEVMKDWNIKQTPHNVNLVLGLLKESNYTYNFNTDKNIKWVRHVINNGLDKIDDKLE